MTRIQLTGGDFWSSGSFLLVRIDHGIDVRGSQGYRVWILVKNRYQNGQVANAGVYSSQCG